MDEQRAWVKSRRKKRLRMLAVTLVFCLLFTTYPDILETLSALAAGTQSGDGTVYVTGFAGLPEEIREQTVPVGAGIEELELPDTLEAFVTVEENTSGETEPAPEEDSDDPDRKEEGTVSGAGMDTETGTEGTDGETGDETGTEGTDEETGDGTGNDGDNTDPAQGDNQTEESGDSTDTDQEGATPDTTEETGETPAEDTGETPAEDTEDTEGQAEEQDTRQEESAPEETDAEEEVQGESAPSVQMEDEPTQETHTVTMPEYQAENVITVETIENTQETGTKEETVMIEGVVWQSAPEYDGNTEGTYLFTAVLPEGYALMEGVSLPQITVTVQADSADSVIQALLERIAALPDAEEYLAQEPDAEEEEAYAEWMEGLYEYAGEALDIQEAYEALTGEQQAQIPEAELAKLMAWMEFAGQFLGNNRVMLAAAAHSHCVCGGSVTTGGHSHDAGVAWTEWTKTKTLPETGGNYYLTDNITLDRTTTISENINLCLNGHKISCTGTDNRCVIIGGRLSICDCQNEGSEGSINLENKYTAGGDSGSGVSINKTGTFSLYGGSIIVKSDVQNGEKALMGLSNNGTAYLYGGSITAIADKQSVNTVVNGSKEGKIYIYGGKYIAQGKDGGANYGLFVKGRYTYLVGNPSFSPKSAYLFSKGPVIVKTGSLTYTGDGLDVTADSSYLGKAVDYLDDSTKPKFNVTSLNEEYKVIKYPVENGVEYILVEAPYTVSYEANGGTGEMASQKFYKHEDDAQLTKAILSKNTFTKSGYAFDGWNTEAAGTGTAYTDGADFSQGLDTIRQTTLYAQWKAAAYNVEYHTNGGTITNASNYQSYTYGNALTLPTPTKTGYTFGGWYTSLDLSGTKVTTISATETGNKEYWAKWTADTYTVAYHTDGGTITNASNYESYIYGKVLTLPTPTKTGYTFGGWYTSSDLSGMKETTISASATGNKEYWAKWTANTYTVTYHTNDGTITNESNYQSYTYGNALTLPTPTKTGYTFGGWYIDSTFSGTAVTKISSTDTGNKTYWAKWTPNKYTVTFNYQGATGSDTEKTRTVTYDSKYGTLPAPTKTGYTFEGWYTAASGGTKITSKTKVITTSSHTLYARWTPNRYTVTFDYQGATGSDTEETRTVTYDSKYGTLPTPTKTGYTFEGWYTAASGGTKVTSTTTVTTAGSHTLYARWIPNKYTVTFNYQGATGGTSTTTQNVTYDSTYGNLPTPTRTGYTFGGWYTKASGGTKVASATTVTTAGSHTLYARWTPDKYTVTFDYQGATGSDTEKTRTVTYDSKYGTLPAPTKTGYTFGGWYTAASGGTNVTSTTTVTTAGSHTLYARWTPNKYTVTFNYQGATGGTSTTTQNVTYDSAYGSLPSPARTGYTFGGWYTAASEGTKVTSTTKVTTTSSHTLYARWTPNKYTVTFNYQGATGSDTEKTRTVTYDSKYGTLPAPTKTGYTFGGWYTAASGGTQVKNTDTVKTAGDHTLYARWNPNKYTVTFDYQGATGGMSTTTKDVTYDSAYVSLPSPTRRGYGFAGWFTAASGGTQVKSTDTVKTAEDHTLYARWNLTTWKITYSLDGGIVTENPTTYTVETPDLTLKNPTKTGYTFAGWSGTDLTGDANMSVTIAKGSTGDRSYTVHWKANTYDVTLNGNGGSGGTPLTGYTYGTGAALPTDWTKTGYNFVGWYDNEELTGTAVTEISVTDIGDMEYWAKWTPIRYTITYSLNGGTAEGNPSEYTIESDTITLNNPTRTGYTFAGWSGTDLTGDANMSVTIAKGSTGDRSYTVHWKANTYDVTLNGNGGSGGTDLKSYTYGTGAALPTDWTKTGYTFDGWYDNADCSGEAVTEISVTDIEDKEYWAKWIDDTAPVIGKPEYSYEPKNLWQWLIGKESLVITVPVTEEGSGADEITCTVTPEGGTAGTKTSAITNGRAKITVSADFKGTITITCTDKAGNTSAGVTVGADLNASGIIIEDNAPEISAAADRRPADTAQTGSFALSESYYECAPAVTVTVKDDTDNAITAGVALAAYYIGETKYPVTVNTASLQEQLTFTIPADRIPAGVTTIKIEAEDNAGNPAAAAITIKVKEPEKKPAAEIGYQTEKLTGLLPNADYTVNAAAYQTDADGCIAVDADWLGTTVTIVKKGNGTETKDSEGQNLPVPKRPEAPAAPEPDSRTDGSITLKTIPNAQYRIADKGWQTGTEFTGLEEKTVYSFTAYYPATDTSFASLPGDSADIATMPKPPTEDKLAVSYVGETFALKDGVEAFTEQTCENEISAGGIADYMGQTLYIRYPADGIIPASLTTAVHISARTEKPDAEGNDASYPGAQDGSVTGLNAAFAYEIRVKGTDGSFGAWEKAEQSGTEIKNLSKGEYEVRVMAVENVRFQSEAAAVTIGEKPATKHDTPAIQIDYIKEALTGFVPNARYSIKYTDTSGAEQTMDITTPDSEVSLEEDLLGTTFSIVRRGNGKDKTDSDAQSLPVPQRPEKPTPAGADETGPDSNDGKLTGLTADTLYEISADGGKTWESGTADAAGEITGLAPGIYIVRIKAGVSNFASKPSEPAAVGRYMLKVTFMANGEIYKTVLADYGKDMTEIPPVPYKKDAGERLYIGEWCSDEQGAPVTFTNLTADMTVYAVYTAVYNVTLNGNGGSGESALTSYIYGKEAALPMDWTKTGYDFNGWYDNAECTGTAVTKISDRDSEDKEYWAKWTPVSYTITYSLDGGTAEGNPTSYTIESDTITLNNPAKTGCTFAGWSGTDLTGDANMSVTIAKGSMGDRAYTAHWTENTYHVTLNGNGGSGAASITGYTYGKEAALPMDWTKTGYAFGGWYDNADCSGTAVTKISGTDIGDKEYWAKWTPVSYTITYSLDGGTAEGNPSGYTIESDTITLNNPAKTGSTFAGWSGTELTGDANMSVAIAKGSTGDRAYTAHWTENTYDVTLESGTGYTLSAAARSASPVKEGGSFGFKFALNKGYKKSGSFAVKVNGVNVELTREDTYIITDIRENKNVTVEGVKKKTSSGGSHNRGDSDDNSDSSTQTGSSSALTNGSPQAGGNTQTDSNTQADSNTSEDNNPSADGNPQTDSNPAAEGGTDDTKPSKQNTEDSAQTSEQDTEDSWQEQNTETASDTEKEQLSEEEGVQTIQASADNGRISVSGEAVATGSITKASESTTKLAVGSSDGAVIVTVVCEEESCTAGVKDTVAVANAVLAPEQIGLVNDGETIEIRVDVKDISEAVPGQDKEVIESGLAECRKEMPDLVLGMYVDISMFIKVGEGDWNAVTSTAEPIEVVVGIPEELKGDGREFSIIRSHDGTYAILPDTDDNPDTITVSTNLFSAYAIAYEQAKDSGRCGLCHICPTFLGICYFIWIAVIVAVSLLIWILMRRRKEEKEQEAVK